MKNYCSADDFEEELAQRMAAYDRNVAERMKKGIDVVSEQAKKEIAARAPTKTGKYKKAFRLKKSVYEDTYNKRNVWYVAAPYYRLTHLLEYGYLSKNGTTRVPAQPHIIYGQRLAEARMIEIAREAARE